jgi:hypothetical protein
MGQRVLRGQPGLAVPSGRAVPMLQCRRADPVRRPGRLTLVSLAALAVQRSLVVQLNPAAQLNPVNLEDPPDQRSRATLTHQLGQPDRQGQSGQSGPVNHLGR